MRRALMLCLLLCGCDSWAPDEMPAGPSDEMDETIEVISEDHADELGLDVEEYRRLVARAPVAAAIVSCGGIFYTEQALNGCSGSGSSAVCRTANTPTECSDHVGANSNDPCQYYTGVCSGGVYTNRVHHDRDLYWPKATPGNPTSTQAYWSLVTGTSPGNSQPIRYRERPVFLEDMTVTEPSAYAPLLEDGDCVNAEEYLRAINPSPGTWIPGRHGFIVPQVLNARAIQVYQGSCATGGRPDREHQPKDRFMPNFVSGLGDAWVLDGGPLSGAAAVMYIRPVSAQQVSDPGDDDGGDDGPSCEPHGVSCDGSPPCCPGETCMQGQCCACRDSFGNCRTPLQCN